MDFSTQRRLECIILITVRIAVFIGSFALAIILSFLSVNAFLAEPGYRTEARSIPMLHEGEEPVLNFKFCDEAPYDFEKAEKNGISSELLSYMTYILQPSNNNMLHFSKDLKNKMQTEYLQKLSELDNDVFKLLDSVTRVCEDYFKENANISCVKDFERHHYGIGGKCYPTSGTFKGLGQAFLDIRAPISRWKNINSSIASEAASSFHGIFFKIHDSNTNHYVLNYEDLTELSYDNYVTILVEKFSTDRTNQHRVIDTPQCHAPTTYRWEDCIRELIQKAMVATYNCSSVLYGAAISGSRYCDPIDSSRMPEAFWHIKSAVNMGSCALDCITNTYKFDIKTVVVTIDDPGKEATQLYVSYKTLTEVKETLTGKSIVDTIAAIGGILGLCFGASILSIVEIIISALQRLTTLLEGTKIFEPTLKPRL